MQGSIFRIHCASATQLTPPKTHRANDMTLLCSSGPVEFIVLWTWRCYAAWIGWIHC